jgi:predicted AlkP superfamily phosphohydrolase/phosphomutase
VLAIGIDAASPELLDAWTADGTLPNLAALRARGLVGRTRGVEGFFVGSTWPSMYTSTNPARHGFHYQMQLVPGTYRLEDRVRGPFVEGDPFWRVLSRAGKRVAVLDVPLSKIESELCGAQVVEWSGHDVLFGYSTVPLELASQIEVWAGRHRAVPSCDASGRGANEYCAFIAALMEEVRRKAEWSTELLARGPWDLFMQVFTESHCVGHQCWHLHDATHPAHDPAMAAITRDPLRLVYGAIDRAVGEIVAAAGDAQVVVFAAHGMSHRYGAHFLLRDLLFALGVAAVPPTPIRERVRAGAARAWSMVPGSLKSLMSPLRDRVVRADSARASVPDIGVDADRSSCFALANGLAVSGIRLNLAGREPRGTLARCEEATRFVERLEADLLAIVDDATGAPLVRRVVRTHDAYEGARIDDLPDLLVEWNETVAIGSTALGTGAGARVRARSAKIGVVEGSNDYARSGEHRPGGWFVATGPNVARGRLEREPSLLDLAPTLAGMLGVELPGAEGEVIAAVAGAGKGGTGRV